MKKSVPFATLGWVVPALFSVAACGSPESSDTSSTESAETSQPSTNPNPSSPAATNGTPTVATTPAQNSGTKPGTSTPATPGSSAPGPATSEIGGSNPPGQTTTPKPSDTTPSDTTPTDTPTTPETSTPTPTEGTSNTPTDPATEVPDEPFSFFVTSLAALQDLSGSPDGFGGDLRYGEATGLAGADKLCTEIAERSMPGSGGKGWHAFLSVTKGGPDDGPIHAKDRIGQGPWYDRLGRVVALDLESLLQQRPDGADPEILNDLPNEDGVPNHSPDGEQVDNHDMLTGTNEQGELYTDGDDVSASTCNDWTSAEPSGQPRVGHPWPTGAGMQGGFGGGMSGAMGGGFGGLDTSDAGGFFGGGGFGGGNIGDTANWMSALDEAGCAPGVFLDEMGPPMADNPTVGSGGGYGGFYCFALKP
ncbi:MAG TPA: hypothetical protein VHM70_14480 [Polyangiaceae bacterium]|nr:hypothetical protein [Polyangiaceae bacterium]